MTRPQPKVEGVRHSFVEAGGLRMHVAEAGPEDGEPVVLLHGWPQHWYEWRELIPRLAEHYRVLCPDLRGLGWTDAPPRGYDKETLAGDVLALLDALGLRQVNLVGHDWGGWAGFLLCLRHPERVRRFLALNIAHPWQRLNARSISTYWRFWYQWVIATPWIGERAVSAGPGGPLHRWLDGGVWSPRDRDIFLSQFAEPARARASVQIYRTFLVGDLPLTLAGSYRRLRLRTPTLLLFGTGDRVLRPHHVEGYEPYADDMRVELVPGVGHFIAEEVPDLVAERARALFAGERQRASSETQRPLATR
jgi:pimeloyl-ACP methyl ester carboxylesterase